MTPERQRIAIAEACGYIWMTGLGSVTTHHFANYKPGDIDELLSKGRFKLGRHGEARDEDTYGLNLVPNYLSDLNAMHKAEKVKIIGTEYESDYCMYLYENAHQCFATAPQRAEAFLRTLNLYIP
jgi:hypothetical protein